MLTLSMPTSGAGDSAVQQEVSTLNQSLNDGLAVIEEFLQSQLDIATLSNELSQGFTAWDMPAQFEALKSTLDLAALSTLTGVGALVGETFAVQNELMNANRDTTLLTIAELLNTHMSALLLTNTMLGANNAVLLMENTLYLAAMLEAITIADINNISAIYNMGQQIMANNTVLSTLTLSALISGFTYTGIMQNLTFSLMTLWFADTAAKLTIATVFLSVIAELLVSFMALQTALTIALASEIHMDSMAILAANLAILGEQIVGHTLIIASQVLIIAALGLINANILQLGEKIDAMLIRLDDIAGNARGIYGNLLVTNTLLSDPTPVNLAMRANELSEQGNFLSSIGNALSIRANIIAEASLAISIASLVISAVNVASGGFPETGQMFIAREAGPELVGTIGGRSAVVNNNQIVEAVSSGVARAVAGVLGSGRGGQNVQVFIGNEELDSYIVKSQRRQALRTNGARI